MFQKDLASILTVPQAATCCGALDALQDLVVFVEFLRLPSGPREHFVSFAAFVFTKSIAKDQNLKIMNTLATASSPAALTEANMGCFCFDRKTGIVKSPSLCADLGTQVSRLKEVSKEQRTDF